MKTGARSILGASRGSQTELPAGGGGGGPLAPGLDLRPALLAALDGGVAFVPAALVPAFAARLAGAAARLPFEAAPERVGAVVQQTDAFVATGDLASRRGLDAPEELRAPVVELARAFRLLVRDQGRGIRGLATYAPNEVAVQRYRAGVVGISGHLDGRRYRRLVAVFTVEGSARFRHLETRSGPVVQEWKAGPGSLVLIRAPGLGGHRDGRPFHAVDGPKSSMRISVTFRMLRGAATGGETGLRAAGTAAPRTARSR